MVKNQLFRVLPDLDIIQDLLNAFGLTTLEDTNFFTKETITELNTVSRFNELKEKDETITYDEILKNVQKRDLMDTTREDSPLIIANDAIEIDNSETNQEDQFHIILQLAKDRIAGRI